MKVRVAPKSTVRLELERDEEEFPAIPPREVALKRILVPTDFSERSRKALHYALAFARPFGAEVLLLHVLEPVTPPPSAVMLLPPAWDTELRDSATRELAKWRRESGSDAVQTTLRSGAPHHEIVRAADETNADLIILGTHGRGGLAHLLIGSTAERVVRHAPCPVMVVRTKEHDFVTEPQTARRGRKGKHHQ